MSARPDFTQIARSVADRATGEGRDKRRDPAAVALGRKGGLKKAENARRRAEEAAQSPA